MGKWGNSTKTLKPHHRSAELTAEAHPLTAH
ncbi:hypothetical protein MSj_02599 [Microcystis aeruginosa Sj]|uniref:Uncharacterized protein n=1 Tax=Microcystis aeruginosa Sj TaxID=1979544 RepID=A0A2Z6UPC3_MICAE|nr:hypothetical protein MSj_02599 [Microcystis aeruginosa Sj]